MCEYLSKLTTEGVNDFMTMIVAFASAVLLYLTFKSQKDSTEIAKQVSVIDRKAKRAEYMPKIIGEIDPFDYPFENDEFGSTSSRSTIYDGDFTTFQIRIIFKKNAVQLLDWEFENTSEHLDITSSQYPFNNDRILLPENNFEINYKINLQKYYKLPSTIASPSLQSLEDDLQELEPHESLSFKNKLHFADMLGNKYELTFNINGLKELTLSDLKMID